MNRIRLRSRFLLVRMLIAAALTAIVILVVRYAFLRQSNRDIDEDLVQCSERLRVFGELQESALPTIAENGWVWATRGKAMCSCDVALARNGELLASSLRPGTEQSLLPHIQQREISAGTAHVLTIAGVPYRAIAIPLQVNEGSPTLLVLKSTQASELQLIQFTRLMAMLAVAAMAVGFFLVVQLSDTFAKPLGNLVEAVRALEKGDFNYPVVTHSDEELEEVTQAFDQMRGSLQETQKQLLRNERLATIGQMASSISHDLRHPLTAIVANSEFLSEKNLPAEQRQALHEEIRAAVEQMNDLIESLLEFSRGRESPHLVDVNLGEVVERAVRSIRVRPEFQSIDIRVECAENLTCFVDPLKIERALRNLLINACEAVQHDSAQVDVSARAVEGAVAITIADNGPGVPDEIRETLFQPFVSYGKAAGTGLGLAVVQKICRDHGGEVTLQSSQAGHTIFQMTLPMSA